MFCGRSTRRALTTVDGLRGVEQALVSLRLVVSDRLNLWNPVYWDLAGTYDEPPSLVLVKSKKSSQRLDEDYVRESIFRYDTPNGSWRSIIVADTSGGAAAQ